MDLRQWFSTRQSRRRALRNLGILAGAGLSIDASIQAVGRGIVSPDLTSIEYELFELR